MTYDHNRLISFAKNVFTSVGLLDERAQLVAKTLVCSDLMGHTTHGLQLLSSQV